ncbi:DUF2971 domain-containing protein [Aquimarina algiphila]|uniref:DUF2971 domain-containing protein n=1 Tax=Aquimarina algiphila TaxID=2047982 RepID=UPI00232AE10D|nr:DUF2971 domain-containing protein [Aquimarina algiphila]
MTEYKYGNFIYRLNDYNNFEVESNIEEPTSIFKYYPNNSNSIDALTNQYLFCSHPFHLNDSMDCSNLLWDFSNISKKQYNAFFSKTGLDQVIEVDFKQDKNNNFSTIRHHLFNFITNGSGIISLTTEPLHTLMWAHYASEKGFMIELDFNDVKQNLKKENRNLKNYALFPVQYVDILESIDCFQEGFKSPDIPFLYSVGIKRKDWSYENEWRLVPFTDNYGIPHSIIAPMEDMKGENERKIYYPRKAIKSIAIGKLFFNGSNIEKIINPYTYKLKRSADLDFVNYLYENFNDRIYFCGEFENDKQFMRSAERIEFNKLNDDTLSIIRKNEGFHQK